MKKKLSLLLVIFLCATFCIPSQVLAQKQGRVEKLLKLLTENEIEKLQKNREKLDIETAQAFENEVGVIDAMNGIWNKSDVNLVSSYYACYEKGMKAALPAICSECKTDIATLRTRTDKVIIGFLEKATDQLSFSKLLIDAVRNTNYPLGEEQLAYIYQVRETALLADIEKEPAFSKFQTYYSEFPESKNGQQVKGTHNALLYKIVKNSPTENNFRAFFDEVLLNNFFGGKDARPHMTEVRSMYDDYLYALIQKSNAATSTKKCIDEYKSSKYLKDSERKYLDDIEYLNDKVDYELLQMEVNSPSALGRIKEYLLAHKYKEFRDKANELRTPFEKQVIWSDPSSMRFYSKGVLLKSNEVEKDRTVSTTYSYNDKGQPGSIEISIEEKKGVQKLQTNLFYDAQGRCALEIQISPATKKEIYKRTRIFGPAGEILSDSTQYTDGRLIVRSYNKQGDMTEDREYNKKGEIRSNTIHQYNEKGWKIKTQQLFPMEDKPSPNQVLSQTDLYEYNKYGYLTKLVFEKIMGNSEKSSGSLIFLYDEYGNRIDSNTYYEYDQTGRWIRRTSRTNPEEVERLQCTYE